MLQVIWRFRAKSAKAADFRRIYSGGVEWAMFFKRAPGFRGTLLLQ